MKQQLCINLGTVFVIFLIHIKHCKGNGAIHGPNSTDSTNGTTSSIQLFISQNGTDNGNTSLSGNNISETVTQTSGISTARPSTILRDILKSTRDSGIIFNSTNSTSSYNTFTKTTVPTLRNNSTLEVASSSPPSSSLPTTIAIPTSTLSETSMYSISTSSYQSSTATTTSTPFTTTERIANMTLNDSPESSSRDDALSARLDRISIILIIFGVTVVVLMLVCLILIGVYMAIMSRRYRDISNELFTLRKMKVHRRISRRETQRETDEIKINLEPPSRRLRHTQSVHGYADKPLRPPSYDMVDRPRSFLVDRPSPPIDPNNYIICKHNSVTSNRSPSRASESDTVQSEC